MGVEPARHPAPHRLARLTAQAVRERQLEARHERRRARQQPPDRRRLRARPPQDAALRIEREGIVVVRDQSPRAAADLGAEDAPGGSTQRPALGVLAAGL
jgi:hypothetical protein